MASQTHYKTAAEHLINAVVSAAQAADEPLSRDIIKRLLVSVETLERAGDRRAAILLATWAELFNC